MQGELLIVLKQLLFVLGEFLIVLGDLLIVHGELLIVLKQLLIVLGGVFNCAGEVYLLSSGQSTAYVFSCSQTLIFTAMLDYYITTTCPDFWHTINAVLFDVTFGDKLVI